MLSKSLAMQSKSAGNSGFGQSNSTQLTLRNFTTVVDNDSGNKERE